MSHNKHVCIECRSINKPCNKTEHKHLTFGYRWRPPKKSDDKAWKRIANGDYLWDHRALRHKQSSRYDKAERERLFRGVPRKEMYSRLHATYNLRRQPRNENLLIAAMPPENYAFLRLEKAEFYRKLQALGEY